MDERLSDEQIAELERLTKAATPGRWEAAGGCLNNWPATDPQPDTLVEFILNSADEGSHPDEDAALFAAARNALPSLLAEVKASRSVPASDPRPMQTCPGCSGVFPVGGEHRCPTHTFGAPASDPRALALEEAASGIENGTIGVRDASRDGMARDLRALSGSESPRDQGAR